MSLPSTPADILLASKASQTPLLINVFSLFALKIANVLRGLGRGVGAHKRISPPGADGGETLHALDTHTRARFIPLLPRR